MIPVFKITKGMKESYIFGEEKLIDCLQDDEMPVTLVDGKLKNLSEGRIVITKSLVVVKCKYEIGEEVLDGVRHVLRVVTVTDKGQYVVIDDRKQIKYYDEYNLFKNDDLGNIKVSFAASKEGNKAIKDEANEHKKMGDFFFKRHNN